MQRCQLTRVSSTEVRRALTNFFGNLVVVLIDVIDLLPNCLLVSFVALANAWLHQRDFKVVQARRYE